MFGKTKPFWQETPLASGYEAVIIGGGVHGLAAAWFLARHQGMKSVAVLEKSWIGSGASGRNTAIVRANQEEAETLPLYREGLELWPRLTRELNVNLMFFPCGVLSLAHSEPDLNRLRTQAATARFFGVEAEMLDPRGCYRLVPALDISGNPVHPVIGGMFHPPGGTLRHDAVVWGLAKGAATWGAQIHQDTTVTGIRQEGGKVVGVETNRGTVETSRVLCAAGADSAEIAKMAGLDLPVSVRTVQALVTHPLKPFLDHVVSSSLYPCYANQTLKGEIVTCGPVDPAGEPVGTTASFLTRQAWALGELMPCLKGVRIMRSWSGRVDVTADGMPIMDGNVPVEGFYIDCGWGDFGFKAGPVAGKYMAEYMVTGERPEVLGVFGVG